MLKFEKKITEWIEKHMSLLYFAVITLLAFYIRYIGRMVTSPDMRDFLLPWYYGMKGAGGFPGLKEQMGDYNVLYQTFVAIMTYLPLNPQTMYKALACIFDYLLAFAAASFVCESLKKERFGAMFNLVYTIVLFLPTVVINSAYWGQCDSMYTFLMVMSLWLLYRGKHKTSFFMLGLAFALKLQTIFILPFIIAYYLVKKSFSIFNFGITVLTFWLSGVPAYIAGRDLLTPFEIYRMQTGTYSKMWLNARSVWILFGDDYNAYRGMAIVLALVLCGLGCYMMLLKKKKTDTGFRYISTAAWFVWVCIYFLPAMHERYAYALDILLVITAFLDKKYIKFAALSAALSFISYGPFLTQYGGVNMTHALIEFFAFIWFTYLLMQNDKEQV